MPRVRDSSPEKPANDESWVSIALVMVGTFMFGCGDLFAKILAEDVGPLQIVWMRYAVFAALVVPAAVLISGRSGLLTRRPKMQALRGSAIVGTTIFFITGLVYLDLPEATAIGFLSPLFFMALSVPLLKEQVGWRRWTAAGVGFLGVLVVMQPGTEAFTLAALLPVGAAACWGVSSVAARMMAGERPEATLAWSALAGVVLLLPFMPFKWQPLNGEGILLALLIGAFSTVGNWLVLLALRKASASFLAPFFYVQLVFASALSWWVYSRPPSTAVIVGGSIIVAAGVYVAYRGRVKAREARIQGLMPKGMQVTISPDTEELNAKKIKTRA